MTPVSTTSVTVAWTTDEAADSRVRYGTGAGGYPETAYNALDLTGHSLTLTGLTPATVYHYVVESTDRNGNTVVSDEGFFETPAPSTSPPAPTIDVVRRTGDYPAYDVLVTFPGPARSAPPAPTLPPPASTRWRSTSTTCSSGRTTRPVCLRHPRAVPITISPVTLAWSRDTYFVDPGDSAHQLKVTIADPAGAITQMIRQFGPCARTYPWT